MRLRRGVTLVEMMIVVALVGLMAGITYPSVSAGLDSLRLVSASDSAVAFLNAALNRAERLQQAVEIAVSQADHSLAARTIGPGFGRTLTMPPGVVIERVLPDGPAISDGRRRFYLFPGGAPPRIALVLRNARGRRRTVSVDPITGVSRLLPAEAP